MDRYEKMYETEGFRIPRYVSYYELFDEIHPRAKSILDNPNKILKNPLFRTYRSAWSGRVQTIEEWMNEMELYEYNPVSYTTQTNKTFSNFTSIEDNIIPFPGAEVSESMLCIKGDAYLAGVLYLAEVKTDSELDNDDDDGFKCFIESPRFKKIYKFSDINHFIPAHYRKDYDSVPDGTKYIDIDTYDYYEDTDEGKALFLFDFFVKYGPERGLFPVQKPPKEFFDLDLVFYPSWAYYEEVTDEDYKREVEYIPIILLADEWEKRDRIVFSYYRSWVHIFEMMNEKAKREGPYVSKLTGEAGLIDTRKHYDSYKTSWLFNGNRAAVIEDKNNYNEFLKSLIRN